MPHRPGNVWLDKCIPGIGDTHTEWDLEAVGVTHMLPTNPEVAHRVLSRQIGKSNIIKIKSCHTSEDTIKKKKQSSHAPNSRVLNYLRQKNEKFCEENQINTLS